MARLTRKRKDGLAIVHPVIGTFKVRSPHVRKQRSTFAKRTKKMVLEVSSVGEINNSDVTNACYQQNIFFYRPVTVEDFGAEGKFGYGRAFGSVMGQCEQHR